MIPHRFLLSLLAVHFATALGVATHAATVEYWDFENSTSTGGAPLDDYPFTDTTSPRNETSGQHGSLGVNGTLARGFNEVFGPSFDSDDLSGPNAGNFSMDTVDNSGDAYLTEGALHNWSSPDWTLELHVKLDAIDSWETIVGRDGSSVASSESDFYLQRKGIDSNELRLNYVDDDAVRHILDGVQTIEPGQWYGFAVTADSTAGTITMYIDDGTGYAQEAQLTGLTGDLGIEETAINWTFGRGWFGGNFVDGIDGSIDNIHFHDMALAASELTPLVPEPASLSLLSLASLCLLFRRRQ